MQPKNRILKAFFPNPISRRTRLQYDRFIEAQFRSTWPSKAPESSSRGKAKVGVFENGKKKKKRGSFAVLDESEDEEDASGKSVEEEADDEDDIVEVNEPNGCGDADDDDDDIVELGEEEKKEEESFVPVGVGLQYNKTKKVEKGKGVFISLDSSCSEEETKPPPQAPPPPCVETDTESDDETTDDSDWVGEDSDGSTWKKYKKRRVGGRRCVQNKKASKKRHVSSSEEEEEEEDTEEDEVEKSKKGFKRGRVAGRKKGKKKVAVSSSEDEHVQVSSGEERSSKKKVLKRNVGRPAKKEVNVSGSEYGLASEETGDWSDEETDADEFDEANDDGGSSEDGVDIPVLVQKVDKVSRKLDMKEAGVSQRTGSQCCSSSSLKKKFETFRHPTKGTDHSSRKSKYVENDVDDDISESFCNNEEVGVGKGDESAGSKEEVIGKEGVLKDSTKMKRVRAPKGVPLFKLFVSTIWEKGGKLQEEEPVTQVEEKEPFLYKFNFGVEVPKPVELTEEQKFEEALWEEFDFIRKSSAIGSFASPVDAKDLNEPKIRTDPSSLCVKVKGEHDFILDEQIGIICRFCKFVKTEIKYILPPVDTSRCYDRSPKKKYAKDSEMSMWEGFSFDDAGGDSQGSFDDFQGTVWDMFPRIRENLYPHQQEGFEFLWKNIAGGIEIEELKKSPPSDSIGGCVISHAPGTGKTLLTIVFLQSYMEVFKGSRAVILAPCSMLLTWEEEFKKWKAKVPFHNLNSLDFSGMEDKMARELINGKTEPTKWTRMVKILSWSKGNSILGVSYPLFEKLAGERPTKDTDDKNHTNEADELRKILQEKPSLLVLDEGHTPRNKRSLIWKALENIKTERRIILSGTPFQNNFEELYNTLSLVRPKFLDSITSSKTQKKEARGKWASLTNSIGKHTDDRLLEKIRAMMAPFVHVHKGSILKDNLPGLRDCMVVLEPPKLQMKLLEQVKQVQNQNGFELEHAVSLVSIHPSLLTKCACSKDEKSLVEEITRKGFNLEEIMSKEFKLDPWQGVKTRFLMELIPLTEAKKEKVLVFSQYIDPFSLIKEQLRHHFNWTEGEEVLQINGRKNMKHRQSMINVFNDPSSKARILLASTRACREGINLVGASRIVLLDVVWNPSVERQAISRAYRLGQKKLVYTYHLITSETIEGEKYRKQVSKDRLSELVFTSTQTHGDKPKSSSPIQDDTILDEMVGSQKLKDMFKEIIYQPKECHLVDSYF